MDPLTQKAAEIAAALWLLDQPGLGPANAWSLICQHGSAQAAKDAETARAARRESGGLFGPDAFDQGGAAAPSASGVQSTSRGRDDSAGAAARILADCERHDIAIVLRGDPAWPERLSHLAQPPLMLFVAGDTGLLNRSGVALVGSRRASVYGRAVARELGAAAIRAGEVVISGLALGIDAAAHEGALGALESLAGSVSTAPASNASNAGVLAVLGSGPERAAPRANAAIYRSIRQIGAVVSEYPPGTAARPWHFPRRNRLLAALADEVIVVEAAEKSGALITARVGLEIGRDVLAVPGRIDGKGARGSNRLLADGARPVVSIEDWLAERGEFDFRCDPAAGSGPAAVDWPEAARVLAEHLTEPIDPPTLARQVAWPLSRLLPLLTELELLGVVHRLPGPRYRKAG